MSHSARMHSESSASATGAADSARHRAFSSTLHPGCLLSLLSPIGERVPNPDGHADLYIARRRECDRKSAQIAIAANPPSSEGDALPEEVQPQPPIAVTYSDILTCTNHCGPDTMDGRNCGLAFGGGGQCTTPPWGPCSPTPGPLPW
jgi:hypothetical protein